MMGQTKFPLASSSNSMYMLMSALVRLFVVMAMPISVHIFVVDLGQK